MKKRILALFLVLALMCGLVTTAFASTNAENITLHFSLEALQEDNPTVIKNSDYDITAPAGTVITVKYYITNTDANKKANIDTSQDEVVYDHNFFDYVEGSARILPENLQDTLTAKLLIDSAAANYKHLIQFQNSATIFDIKKGSTAELGEFKLKIKDGATGTSVIQNTEIYATETDTDTGTVAHFTCTHQDLTVHVGSASDVAVTSVTVDQTASMYVGDTKTLTATVAPDSATTKTVTWSSNNTSVATVNATTGKITAVAEGTANITATSNNGKTGTCAVTVSRKTPSISSTNAPAASVTYGDTVSNDVITGTMIDGATTITGTFAWKDLETYGNASANAKTFNATFTPSGDFIGKYKPVDVEVSVTVAKADQNPSVTATKTLYVGGAAFDLNTLVSDAIGTVTFEMAASDAAELSGSSLTPNTDPTKTGEVKITVKAAGNSNYNAYTGTDAITVTVSNKSAVNVTISGAQDKTYGDQNFTPTATAANEEQSGGTWKWTVDNSGTFEIVSGQGTNSITVKILKANTTGATITASYEDATYAGSKEATIKVAKANPTYTAPTGLTATYGQTLADVTLPAGFSWMDESTTSVGNAGTNGFKVRFTPTDTDNYNVVENIDVNVTVGKASQTAMAPEISAHTDTTITANVVTGQKYQIRKSSEAAPTATSTEWSDTAAFTGLDCHTEYKVYTYIPGNDNHEASPVLSTAQKTDKTAIGGTVTVSNTSPKYGDTLNAVITSVTPEAARSGLTYQWYRDEAAISGATSSSYTVVSDDIGSTIKVKVTGTGNYKGDLTSETTEAVAKADAQTIADQTVSQKYTVITQQSKSVAGLMPNDAGTLTYAKGSEGKTGSVTISSWAVDASTGLVTFTLTGGAAGDTVTLPVKINSTNYAESTVNVVITLVNKENQTVLRYNGETDGTYGKTLNLSATGGSGTGAVSYEIVEGGSGTATINGNVLTPTKAGTVKVKAVKAEDDTYNQAESEVVTITIAKAIPTGDPAYTKITTNGKTLADANLTKNANWPDGTIVWNDGYTTSVEQNKAYRWTFTPTNTNNYTTLTGSIVLYAYHPFNGHAVKLAGNDHGTVETDASTAKPGETVTVEVKADKGYQLYALEVIDYDGNELKLKENKDGSYSFEMPNSSVTVRAQFVAVGDYKLCPRDYTCPIEPYTDTVNDAWWHDGIHYCVENGLMRGITEHEFAPGAFTNRQQVWMILARISGENPANMAEARAWAMKTGVSDGTNPTAPITRQQLAAMLYRFAGSPAVKGELRFTDSDKVSAYAVDAVLWCSDKGIVGGYTDGSFKPLDNASRAHIAAMIQRFCVNILGR